MANIILHKESDIAKGTEGKSMVDYMRKYFGGRIVTGCEVGVYLGIHAKYMLDNLNISKLYLVDPYIKYDGYSDGTSDWVTTARGEADARLSPYSNIDRIYEMSDTASNMVPYDLDFVYIDANHEGDYPSKDIELWYPHVKEGGVFGGHDYIDVFEPTDRKSGHLSVKNAVDEFVVRNGHNELHLTYGHWPDWYVVKNSKS